jgi:hypothetical protein
MEFGSNRAGSTLDSVRHKRRGEVPRPATASARDVDARGSWGERGCALRSTFTGTFTEARWHSTSIPRSRDTGSLAPKTTSELTRQSETLGRLVHETLTQNASRAEVEKELRTRFGFQDFHIQLSLDGVLAERR